MIPHVQPRLDAPLAWGTIGWADGGEDFELGDGSNSDAGITLVKVTLFRGRDPTQPLDQTGKAQGQEILCQLGSMFYCVPPNGWRVLVANPEPHGLVPGNATIIQIVDPRGATFTGNRKQGELCVGDLVGMGRVITNGKGAIVLFTTDDNTPSGQSLSVYLGPDKLQLTHVGCAISLDPNNGIALTAGQATITLKPDGTATLSGQEANVVGSSASIAGSVVTSVGANPGSMTLIGPNASPATPAIAGPSALAGVPSLSVFVSPT